MRKFTLLIASLFITIGAMAQTATTYADGVYKIFWQYDQRGYLTYHADYPNDPQLAGVVNHNPNGHYQLTDEGIQLSWYLYTSATTSKSYLFEATTGKFITIDMNTASANGKRCALSEVVSEFAQFDLKATTNTTAYMLSYEGYNFCSGCGTDKGAGPVRFATNGQSDGGVPFVFVTDGASITDEVKNAAIAKIEAFEADNTVAVAELDEAIDKAIAMSAFIGTGVGKYSYTGDGSYNDKFAAIVAFRQGITSTNTPTPEEVAAKTAELNALLSLFVLNMPEAGNYYRLKGVSGNYIDATSLYDTNSRQMSMKSAGECNLAGTIFYYDNESHLLNYATGTYTRETREIGTIGYAYKSVWNITASPRNNATYALEDTNRENTRNGAHLHDNAGNRADRCSSNCGTRHDFVIEAVTELPVTISTAGYATLYAPVALTVPSQVKAYTVTINGEWATLNEIANGIIPANTGVVIAGANGEAADEGTYNFAITTTGETLESDLRGSVAATYYTEAGTYYALAQVDGVVGFYKDQFNNDRFQNNSHKAYLYVASEGAEAASYSFRFGEGTTGVEKVVVENGVKAIFDLTGRRVENPSNGIYIINGVKTLVK